MFFLLWNSRLFNRKILYYNILNNKSLKEIEAENKNREKKQPKKWQNFKAVFSFQFDKKFCWKHWSLPFPAENCFIRKEWLQNAAKNTFSFFFFFVSLLVFYKFFFYNFNQNLQRKNLLHLKHLSNDRKKSEQISGWYSLLTNCSLWACSWLCICF